MELLSVIRRWHYRDRFSIREISRRTGLSRNTVRKYLRSDSVEPKFSVPDRPSRLDPYADKLSHMLRQEAGKSRKQKRTIKRLHADLVALGYDGSYNRVAAFARDWKAARQLEQRSTGRGVFAPLAFGAGEAFQFDSHGVLKVKRFVLAERRLVVGLIKSQFEHGPFGRGLGQRRSICRHLLLAAKMASARRGSRMRSTGEAGASAASVLDARLVVSPIMSRSADAGRPASVRAA